MKIRSLILILGLALQAATASAQEGQAQQVLDRVFAYTPGAVLNMAFGNADRPPDFTNLGVNASSITDCTLTAVDGLWCLDGRIVRKWPNPLDPSVRIDVLNCSDPALGFQTTIPCTGMAVDKSGGIWLAGKKRLPNNWPPRPWWIPEPTWIALQTWFKPYSLVKVVAKVGSCPVGTTATVGGAYCAKEMYSGRYLVTNLSAVDGDAAKEFRPCPSCSPQAGVLGVEDLRNVLFFPDPQAAQPIVISGGWGTALKFGELLQDVSLLQLPGTSAKQNHVLATTNFGRVMSKNTATGGLPVPVFNIPAERTPTSVKCSNVLPVYGVRSSPAAAIVFVTDRQYCQVSALMPNGPTFTALVNLQGGGVDLTLRTKDSSGTFPIIGLTVAPGIGIDFRACNLNCAIVNSAAGEPAAELSGITLAEGSGFAATVFQVADLPDCRYAFKPDFPVAKRNVCATTPGVVIDPNGNVVIYPNGTNNSQYPPAAQFLNVTPLLPTDVTASFDNSGVPPQGLPKLLISRQYRGQARNHFLFEALFVVPNPNVRFTGVFGGEYDVPALEGAASSLGCLPTQNLLDWDVTTAVSEAFISVNGRYIDSLANSGCGSVKGSYGKLSLLPYDLEVVPDTFGPTVHSSTPVLTTGNDAVFARLVQSLYSDLGYVLKELACKQADQSLNVAPPLTAYECNTLKGDWELGLYKLNKCLEGVFKDVHHDYGKRQYCQYVLSYGLDPFANHIPANTPSRDIANRIGELRARTIVLRHLYVTRFLPSVPNAGFCKERNNCWWYPTED